MTNIIQVLIHAPCESELEFKKRCSDALMNCQVDDPSAYAIGRTHATPRGLESSMQWGSAQPGLPAEHCVIAWWPKSDARLQFHTYDPARLDAAIEAAATPMVLQAAEKLSRIGDQQKSFCRSIVQFQLDRVRVLARGFEVQPCISGPYVYDRRSDRVIGQRGSAAYQAAIALVPQIEGDVLPEPAENLGDSGENIIWSQRSCLSKVGT